MSEPVFKPKDGVMKAIAMLAASMMAAAGCSYTPADRIYTDAQTIHELMDKVEKLEAAAVERERLHAEQIAAIPPVVDPAPEVAALNAKLLALDEKLVALSDKANADADRMQAQLAAKDALIASFAAARQQPVYTQDLSPAPPPTTIPQPPKIPGLAGPRHAGGVHTRNGCTIEGHNCGGGVYYYRDYYQRQPYPDVRRIED